LRILLEAYAFSFLAVFSEVYRTEEMSQHPLSYTISAVFLLLMVLSPVVLLMYYLRKRNQAVGNPYVKELFKDLRMSHLAKLYHVYFLFRRIFMVMIIVLLESIDSEVRLTIFTSFQLFSLIFIIIFRPFDDVKDNIIEIINEASYLILCFMMVAINRNKFEGSLKIMPMVYTVMINGAIVIIIMNSSHIIALARLIKIKCCKKILQSKLRHEQI